VAPKIDDIGGFEIVINRRDHPPPHVHVLRDDADLRVYLTGSRPAERKYGRMNSANERRAVSLVKKNRETYLAKWKEIDPQQS
jgi:hypothetical protein